jgi:hypothetical protein
VYIIRRFFVCRSVNWEPLRQFTSNFVLLLELIVFTDFSAVGWNLDFSFKSYGKESLYKYCNYQFQKLCEVWSELAKGFSIYSATYEKSPTIWWIKPHNSAMKIRNFTIQYIDRKTINSNNSVKFVLRSVYILVKFRFFHSRVMGLFIKL